MKSKCKGHAYQATIEETQEPSTNSDAVLFTKEQLEHLYKLFQSPKLSLTPSCSLVQKSNSLATAFLGVIPNSVHSWIIDSRVTDHMTGCSKLISSYSPCAGNKKSQNCRWFTLSNCRERNYQTYFVVNSL